jgi:D-serine deaminase-like pyridoxal phosphate-dependent protein
MAGVEIGVLVDVNVGLPRCGIAPGEPAVVLATHIATDLVLRGVMGYEAAAVGIADRAAREANPQGDGTAAVDGALDAWPGCTACTSRAGGTGTFDITGAIEGITEIQAGSYVLMDTAYAQLDIPFEQAFSVLGTVLSRPRPEQCAADNGHRPAPSTTATPVKG